MAPLEIEIHRNDSTPAGAILCHLIAWPIIYLAMDRWLQHFAYRIELSPTPFVLGSLLTFGIALLTVSTQAWKAARTNPAETLRYE